jgi:hypothetical protein
MVNRISAYRRRGFCSALAFDGAEKPLGQKQMPWFFDVMHGECRMAESSLPNLRSGYTRHRDQRSEISNSPPLSACDYFPGFGPTAHLGVEGVSPEVFGRVSRRAFDHFVFPAYQED